MSTKRKLTSFYVAKRFSLDIAKHIRAETIEEALATVKAMRFHDFIETDYEVISDDVIDGGLTVADAQP